MNDGNQPINPNDPNDKGGKKRDEPSNFRSSPTLKPDIKYDDLRSFVKENTKETIAYVLIIAGILMMFFDSVSMYGGLLIGLVIGFYFASELADIVNNYQKWIDTLGQPKSLLLALLLLIILIKLPFIVLGVAIVAGLKLLFADKFPQ